MTTYTIDKTTWRSPNFTPRPHPPASVVVHSCEGSLPYPRVGSLPWLCSPASHVAAHYYVCRDTDIFELVHPDLAAWHAGDALSPYINSHSIGVECEHHVGQDWPTCQRDALAWLLRDLMERYGIHAADIETHGQVALPGPYKRKVDPSDWPHADFLAWRQANVAKPPAAQYRTLIDVFILESPGANGKIALAGTAFFGRGVILMFDEVRKDGWAHLASGLGFVPVSYLEKV